MNIGRHHDLEQEQSVLGAVFLVPNAAHTMVERLLRDHRLSADHFYRRKHGLIWNAMVELYDANEPIDPVTVSDRLGDQEGVDRAYLHTLGSLCPSVGSCESYGKRVVELAERRRLAQTLQEMCEAFEQDDMERFHQAEMYLQPEERRHETTTPAEFASLVWQYLERGDDTGIPLPWHPMTSSLAGGLRPATVTLIGGYTSHGKAVALDTPVPTPNGWKTMGVLKAGDYVFDERGVPTRIMQAFEVLHGRDCYELEFSDGSTVVADADHQWFTWTHAARVSEARAKRRELVVAGGPFSRDQTDKRARPSVVTTEEIAETLRTSWGRLNHAVEGIGALQYGPAMQPVDPYVLGIWLGDGTAVSGDITSADQAVIDEIRAAGYQVTSDKQPLQHCVRGIAGHLRELGVLGNKHIPECYQRAAEAQRLALLQGLMDSDGTCGKHDGRCVFAVTNRQLAEDVLELATGLGLHPRWREQAKSYNGKTVLSYSVGFTTERPVFRLNRKLKRQSSTVRSDYRTIVAVRPCASVPVRCIAVDSPSHQFLVGRGCVPTHNSFLADQILEHAVHHGCTAHIYMNEMSQEDRAVRAAARITGIPLSSLLKRDVDRDGYQKIARLENKMPYGATTITDWTVDEIARDIRRKRWGVACVDLVHLIPFAEERELAAISAKLKHAALRSNTALLEVVHLNRKRMQQAYPPAPAIGDVRWSGSLAENADNVMLLYRKEARSDDGDPLGMQGHDAVLDLAKARNGRLGQVRVRFDERRGTFELPSDREDQPF